MSAHLAAATRLVRLRRTAGRILVDNTFRGLALAGLAHPAARPGRHGVEVEREISYRRTGERAHRLDVYRPRRGVRRPTPALLYVHGGGFRILSKDSHWLMGLAFARRGYTVFNVSYRLAPRHPRPLRTAPFSPLDLACTLRSEELHPRFCLASPRRTLPRRSCRSPRDRRQHPHRLGSSRFLPAFPLPHPSHSFSVRPPPAAHRARNVISPQWTPDHL